MSDFGLSRSPGVPVRDARALSETYFVRFPGVRSYSERTIEEARSRGYVTTLPPFRRKRYLPGLRAGNRSERLMAERAGVNAPIQGTAADIIKQAMLKIHAEMERRGLRSRMLLQVHDELLFEVLPAEQHAMVALVRRQMCDSAELDVPLRVDLRIGQNWRDMDLVLEPPSPG